MLLDSHPDFTENTSNQVEVNADSQYDLSDVSMSSNTNTETFTSTVLCKL